MVAVEMEVRAVLVLVEPEAQLVVAQPIHLALLVLTVMVEITVLAEMLLGQVEETEELAKALLVHPMAGAVLVVEIHLEATEQRELFLSRTVLQQVHRSHQ